MSSGPSHLAAIPVFYDLAAVASARSRAPRPDADLSDQQSSCDALHVRFIGGRSRSILAGIPSRHLPLIEVGDKSAIRVDSSISSEDKSAAEGELRRVRSDLSPWKSFAKRSVMTSWAAGDSSPARARFPVSSGTLLPPRKKRSALGLGGSLPNAEKKLFSKNRSTELTSTPLSPRSPSPGSSRLSPSSPLSDQEIARQVQYLLNNGWTPCIEFESADKAYADSHGWTNMDYSVNAGYYDNRYWVMWKLPMYGCTNPEEVLRDPLLHPRLPRVLHPRCGFDNIKQVQCSSFLAHRPTNDRTFAPVDGRQAGDKPMQSSGGW